MKNLYCIFFVLFFSNYLLSQEDKPIIAFEKFSLKEGLSSSSVICILQDQEGFLWIGTPDGLNRYDGYQFTTFRNIPNDTSSLSNNWVETLNEDYEGVLWVGTKRGLNRLDKTTGKFHRYLSAENLNSLSDNHITAFYQAIDSVFWIGTVRGGLNRFDLSKNLFTHYQWDSENPYSIGKGRIDRIDTSKKGKLWIATRGGGLNLMDVASEKFTRFLPDANTSNSINDQYLPDLFCDGDSLVWIGTETGGLNQLDLKTMQFKNYKNQSLNPDNKNHNFIKTIFKDNTNRLWIGERAVGLKYFDSSTEHFTTFSYIPSQPNSVGGNSIHTIYQDRGNNVWLGVWVGGLNRIKNQSKRFNVFSANPKNSNSLSHRMVTSFHEEDNGNLWIGTWGGGLNYYNKQTKQFKSYQYNPSIPHSLNNNRITEILSDKLNNLWVTTDGGGLNKFNKTTEQFTHFLHSPTDANSINSNRLKSLYEDAAGNLWIGSAERGLNRFAPNQNRFFSYVHNPLDSFSLSDNHIKVIFEDAAHTLWIGTNVGLNRMDSLGKFYNYQFDASNPNSLSENHVIVIFEDSAGRFWVGTNGGGLNLMDRATGQFTHFRVKDGLPNDVVYAIEEDNQKRLWVSTNLGLSCFDPDALTFINFDLSDGLQSLEYNALASIKSSKTGALYFGGINGFNTFHPDKIQLDNYFPPIAFSSLTLFNEGQIEKDYFIQNKKNILIPYQERIFSFEFSALGFNKSNKILYKYKLEGFKDNWFDLGNKREVTFTNLNPGNYTLLVKSTNSDRIWGKVPAKLQFTILPPWYQTWWAYTILAILLTSLLYSFYRIQLNRQLAKAETIRLRELDETKTRLYTNITHEFRTPITIILGMVNQMVQNQEKWFAEGTKMIKRNGQQLLNLVDQMLNLNKLESGFLPTNMIQGDVIPYLRYLTESFHSYAISKNISLHFQTEVDNIRMDYDPDKLLQIVSNLLSNALKYTSNGGTIYLEILVTDRLNIKPKDKNSAQILPLNNHKVKDYLELSIQDTGIGIPNEQLPFIFDRFFQTADTLQQQGTGIGLALTKELVKLLGGGIEANSQKGKGTQIRVWLPIHQNAKIAMEIPKESLYPTLERFTQSSLALSEVETFANTKDLPLLLIIEDNSDVIRYLTACLAQNYQIQIAQNGQEGIDKALECIPDIIISDVMMPLINGFEVIRFLKNDIRTSHIPLILLTAKVDIPSRIQGLKRGADAYLAKPFNKEELLVRLNQLIKLRKQLQQQYQTGKTIASNKNVIHLLEDEFLMKFQKIIQQYLSESDFDMQQLEKEMGMSRSQIFRKIKALTNKNITSYICSIRLQKAKELLETTDLKISEITYKVGFSSPSYFSKMFLKEFGSQPSSFKK